MAVKEEDGRYLWQRTGQFVKYQDDNFVMQWKGQKFSTRWSPDEDSLTWARDITDSNQASS